MSYYNSCKETRKVYIFFFTTGKYPMSTRSNIEMSPLLITFAYTVPKINISMSTYLEE